MVAIVLNAEPTSLTVYMHVHITGDFRRLLAGMQLPQASRWWCYSNVYFCPTKTHMIKAHSIFVFSLWMRREFSHISFAGYRYLRAYSAGISGDVAADPVISPAFSCR